MANGIPFLNDWQPDDYPMVYDESESQIKYVKEGVKINVNGGGSGTIPETAYDTNAEAVAALGVGQLYKSTTLINGSPIILITV